MKSSLKVGLSALSLVFAAGCSDRNSPTTKAIETGSREITVSAAAPGKGMATAYDKVGKDLGAASANASAGEKAAAQVLVSQTQGALGEAAAGDAASLERQALNSISVVEGYLAQWRMRSAVGAAADAYDPSAQLAEIAKSKSEKDAEVKAEQAHRQQVQAQLTDLQGKAKQKMDAASAKEDIYAKGMQQSVKLSATEAAPIVQQANVVKREADALRLDGTKYEAQAQTVAPQITEIDAIIAQLTNQMKDLDATAAMLTERKNASKAEASEARAGATAANVEVEKGVADLVKQRGEIDAAYSKALGYLNKAAAAAKESTSQAPTSGKASTGDVQMSIANLHWQKAEGLRAYANLLDGLAKAEPAMPGKADDAQKAKDARDAAKQELEAAASALDSAKTAFGGASGRMGQDGKEKIQKLQDLLDKSMAVTKDDGQTASADLDALTGRQAKPADKAEAPAPAGSTPAAAAAPADPALVAAIDAYFDALRDGRYVDAEAMTYVPDSAKASVEANKPVTAAFEKVDKAFKGKFGKGFIEAMTANPMMAGMASQFSKATGVDPTKIKDVKASSLNIAVNGDTGTASGGVVTTPITFKKVDGKWLHYDKSLENPAAAAMDDKMAPAIAKGFEDLAGEVDAGKYPDANAAIMGFMQKMAAAMGGGPPGGGKKGPGGGG